MEEDASVLSSVGSSSGSQDSPPKGSDNLPEYSKADGAASRPYGQVSQSVAGLGQPVYNLNHMQHIPPQFAYNHAVQKEAFAQQHFRPSGVRALPQGVLPLNGPARKGEPPCLYL